MILLVFWKSRRKILKFSLINAILFVSRVSDDLLESEKVKINEFKDVYSSIDSKIYKLKVNSWLDSNRNNLIDFNNEISGEISNLVLDDDVEELKKEN